MGLGDVVWGAIAAWGAMVAWGCLGCLVGTERKSIDSGESTSCIRFAISYYHSAHWALLSRSSERA
jgi:hypothetical protein